jgi:hypothetical protein
MCGSIYRGQQQKGYQEGLKCGLSDLFYSKKMENVHCHSYAPNI